MSFKFPAFNKKAVVSFVEHAATAAVIGAYVAYEAGARDYKVVALAGVAAGLNFIKHFVQEAVRKPAA